MARQVANPEKAETQEAAEGYRIIQTGPRDFSVEGFFHHDGSQRIRSAKGFPSEIAARQWVYDQLAEARQIVNLEKLAAMEARILEAITASEQRLRAELDQWTAEITAKLTRGEP